MDAYLTSLQQSTKPLLKSTKANPEDWDVALAIECKNHAAMDGLLPKAKPYATRFWEAARPTVDREAHRNVRNRQL
jgi:hypothetical protein